MGLFTKKENIHFKRNEEGEVVDVQRSGDVEKTSRTPVSDKLIGSRSAYQEEKREKRKQMLDNAGKRLSTFVKTYDPEINHRYKKKKKTTRYEPAGRFRGNYNPIGNMFDTGLTAPRIKKKTLQPRYAVVGGKVYPIAGMSKTKKKKKQNRGGMMGFDMADNWGLL